MRRGFFCFVPTNMQANDVWLYFVLIVYLRIELVCYGGVK